MIYELLKDLLLLILYLYYLNIDYSNSIVEIYHSSERIASHQRFPYYMTNKYSTNKSHLPDQFNQPEWNADRLINWARNIGPSTLVVVERIFDSKRKSDKQFIAFGANKPLFLLYN